MCHNVPSGHNEYSSLWLKKLPGCRFASRSYKQFLFIWRLLRIYFNLLPPSIFLVSSIIRTSSIAMSIKKHLQNKHKEVIDLCSFFKALFQHFSVRQKICWFQKSEWRPQEWGYIFKRYSNFSFSSVGQNYVFKNTGKNAEYWNACQNWWLAEKESV